MINKLSLSLFFLIAMVCKSIASDLTAKSYYLYDIQNRAVIASDCHNDHYLVDAKHSFITYFALEDISERQIDLSLPFFQVSLMGVGQPSYEQLLSTQIVWNSNEADNLLITSFFGGETKLQQRVNALKKEKALTTNLGNPYALTTCELGRIYKNIYLNFNASHKLFGLESYEFNNSSHPNHNHIKGIDGLTGLYTLEKGGELVQVFSFDDQERHFVGAIHGENLTEGRLITEIEQLISHAKKNSKFVVLQLDDEKLPKVNVRYGVKDKLQVKANDVVKYLSTEENIGSKLSASIKMPAALNAPINKGEKVGEAFISIGKDVHIIDIIAAEKIEEVNLLERVRINIDKFMGNKA